MMCKVTDVSVKQGKSQCLWSSCREGMFLRLTQISSTILCLILFSSIFHKGCTSDMYQCYQVRVQYIDQDYKNNTYIDEFQDRDWKNLSRYDSLENEVQFMTSSRVKSTVYKINKVL